MSTCCGQNVRSSILLREPYRFFFPLGILSGLMGVGHWVIYALGWAPSYSGIAHAGIQMLSYALCFVLGFLLTAMPKFSGTAPASSAEFSLFAILIIGILLCFQFQNIVVAEICFGAALLHLGGFAARRIGQRRSDSAALPPVEFVWISIAIFHGLTGAVLISGIWLKHFPAAWTQAARAMTEQGFLLCIVTGIGGFMAPRLMGRTEILQPFQLNQKDRLYAARRKRAFFYLLMGLGLLASFVLEAKGFLHAAYFLRALVPTWVFALNHAWPYPPRMKQFYVKLLTASLWMIVLGSWVTAFFPDHRKTFLHLVFLGGYSLMIFSVATMVIYSHGGVSHRLEKPVFSLWAVAVGVGAAVAVRVAADFFPEYYFQFVGTAGFIWLITGLVWLVCMAPHLLRVPEGEEFEKAHEEAKKRVQQVCEPPASEGPSHDHGSCCH